MPAPARRPAQTIGMPSGVVKPAALWMSRSAVSVCDSMTPCMPVTHTYCLCALAIQSAKISTVDGRSTQEMPTPSTSTRVSGTDMRTQTTEGVLPLHILERRRGHAVVHRDGLAGVERHRQSDLEDD